MLVRTSPRTNASCICLITLVLLTVAGCSSQRSNRPLLSTPPSASAGTDIYVADARARIRDLRSDGSEQWAVSLPDEIARIDNTVSRDIRIEALAARSSGKVFGLATELSGRQMGTTLLFALDGKQLVWHVEAPYPEQNGAPIAIGPDAIYEAAQDGGLYAFARADGKQMWKYQVSQGALGSPMVGADGTVYVTGPNYNLHAISPEGTQRWAVDSQK